MKSQEIDRFADVLVVSNYSGMYGSERMLFHLVRALEKILISKIVLNPAVDVDFNVIGHSSVIAKRFKVVSKGEKFGALFDVFKWVSFFLKEKPKCVVLNISLIPAAVFAGWVLGIKVVVFVRESLVDHRFFFGFYKNYLLFFSRFVVCNSTYTASMFGDHKKVLVIKDCVDGNVKDVSGTICSGDFNVNFLYVGRLSERKGLAVLADALEKLDGAVLRDVSVSLVGDYLSDQESFVSQVTQRLSGLKKVKVIFRGFDSDPWQFATQGTVLIAPSILPETFGLTVAEALVRGVPVVASRVGAYPELVLDGQNGFLYSGSSEDLFLRLLELCSLKVGDYKVLSASAKSVSNEIGCDCYEKNIRRLFCEKFHF